MDAVTTERLKLTYMEKQIQTKDEQLFQVKLTVKQTMYENTPTKSF